ncbi:MAG: hypothetical protein ACOC80_05755, partial [Petrotogales bacterium]
MKIDEILRSIKSPFIHLFDKDNFTFKNILCSTTILLSILMITIGLSFVVLSYYIGDGIAKILLGSLGLLFIIQFL